MESSMPLPILCRGAHSLVAPPTAPRQRSLGAGGVTQTAWPWQTLNTLVFPNSCSNFLSPTHLTAISPEVINSLFHPRF